MVVFKINIVINTRWSNSFSNSTIIQTSPSFKFVPKQPGELNHGNRKDYQRADKAQKYFYNGIP